MNKKKKVRHSGKLKSYMQWPAVVAVLLVMLDILVFAIDESRISGILFYCRLLGSDVCSDAALPSVCSPRDDCVCIPVFPDPERDAEKFFHSVCGTRYGWKSTLDE